MTKRYLGSSSPVDSWPDKPASKKTERSHEENQERAYIAASRRTDRSLEARVQSARMASEIHKKRTGKGFNITEEIVQKEEMYEEDQDDFPRRYSAFALLGDQLRTSSSSSGTNNFTNPYSTYEAAIAILTRQQEIDRLFAEHFPNAAQIAQSQSLHAPNSQHIPQLPNHPCGPEQTQPAPDSALFSKLSSYPDSTSYHSFSSTSAFTTDEPISPRGPPTSGSASISRPGATPTSSCSDDSDDRAAKRRRASVISVDPSLTMSATLTSTNSVDSSSRLTLELPSERKLIGEDIENNQIVPVPHHKGELAAGLSCFSTEAQQCFSATSSDRLPLTTYNQQPVPTQQEEPTSFLSSSDPTFEFPNMQAYNGNPGWYSPPLGCGSGAPNHGDVNWDQWLTDHENLSLQIPVDSRSHATQRQN